MTKEILTNKLANEQLNQVNGGTFDSNKHDERIYNQAGMRTDYLQSGRHAYRLWFLCQR